MALGEVRSSGEDWWDAPFADDVLGDAVTFTIDGCCDRCSTCPTCQGR